ncbi:MAG: aminotransferase class I/II-fold pyridoxal phosphate-dependent enzyme [Pseudomonadota bacterium]
MFNYRTQNVIFPPIVQYKKKLISLCDRSKLIDLCQAMPSYPMPKSVKQVLAENFNDSLSFYTEDQGLLELRELVATLHNSGGVKITADEIIISAGGNNGMLCAFMALFKKGDKVALPVPYYFNYDMALKMLDVEPFYYHLDENDGFKIKFDNLDKNIFKQCKGFVVVNPNNPTGAESDIEELKKIYAECKKNNSILLSDEVYGFFAQNGYPNSSILSAVKELDNLVVVNSFSKIFSLTGFRVGYSIAKQEIMDEIMKVQDTAIICAPRVSQSAAIEGLKNCIGWLKEKATSVNANSKEFTSLFNSAVKGFKIVASGNFFAYLKHPYDDKDDIQTAELIAKKTNMIMLPASIFGPKQEKYLRLAFGNLSRKEDINQVVERFKIMV